MLGRSARSSAEAILERLQPGLIIEGQISNIVDFGAFVDLDGIDGLIHISELSWSHVNHPSEILSIGDTVQVKVLDIDRDRQRISLGLKQTQEDPWQRVVDTYHVGDELEGTVTKVVAFGAFVEIMDGVEGLVHISELLSSVENPREIVQPGDEVKVKILEIETERRRLSLSIKRVEGQVPAPPGDRHRRSRERPRARPVRGRVRRAAAARARGCVDEAPAEPRPCEPAAPAGPSRPGARGGRGAGRPEPEAAVERGAAEPEPAAGRGCRGAEPAAEPEPGRGASRGAGRARRRDLSRPRFVGLTGGIGAGKSEALAALRRLGAATLSADAVVHELYEDPEVRAAVVARWGDEVAPDGTSIAAPSPAVLRHAGEPGVARAAGLAQGPRAGRRVARGRVRPRAAAARALVVEVPLLFEAGQASAYDATIAVVADDALRAERAARAATRRSTSGPRASSAAGKGGACDVRRAQLGHPGRVGAGLSSSLRS